MPEMPIRYEAAALGKNEETGTSGKNHAGVDIIMSELFVRTRKRPGSRQAKARRYYKQRTEAFKEQGLCPRCGNVTPTPPFVHCEDCRKMFSVKYRKALGLPLDHPRGADRIATSAALVARREMLKKRPPLPGRNPATPKTGNTWQPADKEMLVKMFADRVPLEEICTALGRSQRAVLRYGHKIGIADCDPNNFTTPYLAARIKSW